VGKLTHFAVDESAESEVHLMHFVPFCLSSCEDPHEVLRSGVATGGQRLAGAAASVLFCTPKASCFKRRIVSSSSVMAEEVERPLAGMVWTLLKSCKMGGLFQRCFNFSMFLLMWAFFSKGTLSVLPGLPLTQLGT
jgi:hypothetical protein